MKILQEIGKKKHDKISKNERQKVFQKEDGLKF